MSAELLEIHPRELKFIFELKKQSTCSVRLVNKSNSHVAFKVKTTSPKKYCVRPNTGVIVPKSSCDFTVTMQAQKSAPPDMVCKDKFLVQSTVVPEGTTDEDINASMVSNDGGYIEEDKLTVILVSPPSSPVLSPINGTLKQVSAYEASTLKDQFRRKTVSFTPHHPVNDDVEWSNTENREEVKRAKDGGYNTMKVAEEPARDTGCTTMKDVEERMKYVECKPTKDLEYITAKDMEAPTKDVEYITTKGVDAPTKDAGYIKMKDVEEPTKDAGYVKMKDVEELKLVKDIEDMKSKLNELDSKLSEAEVTISKLTEERRWTAQETEGLRQELALLRSKKDARKVQVGFPFLFVCMVAVISVLVGYLLNR
ncbi:vesicle-associated protein 1-2-like isoform X2 [Rhododendron vialii]|uniref:vesicle-associated protein 1-2-like isoform X2 n=1 Tax=Rhododendron vialii TaxID=182163 RepID=UPI00265FAA36|nr:vesicle-associated protein 1-2-like isoform X2 [Rhododendron vialii]